METADSSDGAERVQWTGPWGRTLVAGLWGGAFGLSLVEGRRRPSWARRLADAAFAASAAGALLPMSGVWARAIVGVHPEAARGRFTLTFDDGPHPDYTPRVLDLLERRGHRATFFVIGRHAERHPALLEEIARRGHELGNHSFAHSRRTPFAPLAGVLDDYRRAGELIAAASHPPRWFRAPAGVVTARTGEALRRLGLGLVAYSTCAHDGTVLMTARLAAARLLRGLRPGAILVLHDGVEEGDAPRLVTEILPRLLDEAEARGLRSVTLTELVEGPVDRDSLTS